LQEVNRINNKKMQIDKCLFIDGVLYRVVNVGFFLKVDMSRSREAGTHYSLVCSTSFPRKRESEQCQHELQLGNSN